MGRINYSIESRPLIKEFSHWKKEHGKLCGLSGKLEVAKFSLFLLKDRKKKLMKIIETTGVLSLKDLDNVLK